MSAPLARPSSGCFENEVPTTAHKSAVARSRQKGSVCIRAARRAEARRKLHHTPDIINYVTFSRQKPSESTARLSHSHRCALLYKGLASNLRSLKRRQPRRPSARRETEHGEEPRRPRHTRQSRFKSDSLDLIAPISKSNLPRCSVVPLHPRCFFVDRHDVLP